MGTQFTEESVRTVGVEERLGGLTEVNARYYGPDNFQSGDLPVLSPQMVGMSGVRSLLPCVTFFGGSPIFGFSDLTVDPPRVYISDGPGLVPDGTDLSGVLFSFLVIGYLTIESS